MSPNSPQRPQDRAQADAGRMSRIAISFILALLVASLVGAVVLPIGIDAIVDDRTETVLNQSQTTTEAITPVLDAELASDSDAGNATYNLTVGDDTVSKTIAEGSDADYTLNGQTVNVNVSDAQTTEASATFEYPVELGWSTGTQSMWNILDVVIVLAVFLFVFGIALAATDSL